MRSSILMMVPLTLLIAAMPAAAQPVDVDAAFAFAGAQLTITDAAVPAGASVQVAVYGRMLAATVQPGTCLWDPDNTRLIAAPERSLAHGSPA
mgnify:CR=1 FL=1